jgi:hypothetical protein
VVSETRLPPAPSHADLLRTAYEWGRVDGLLAADFEPLEGARSSSAVAGGRDPADFARPLWHVPGVFRPPGTRSTRGTGMHAASRRPCPMPGPIVTAL